MPTSIDAAIYKAIAAINDELDLDSNYSSSSDKESSSDESNFMMSNPARQAVDFVKPVVAVLLVVMAPSFLIVAEPVVGNRGGTVHPHRYHA